MPQQLSYPGVYVEEIPSGVRTITGVATSITAFIGRAWKGPLDDAVTITSIADYERMFGGLWRKSTMSYAVSQFFENGGNQALIVRVALRSGLGKAKVATLDLGGGNKLTAASPGTWGRNLRVLVDHNTKPGLDNKTFNLTVIDDQDIKKDSEKKGGSGARETFLNVSVTTTSPRYLKKILEQQSQLLRVDTVGANPPVKTPTPPNASHGEPFLETSGDDGKDIVNGDINVSGGSTKKQGIFALQKADLFNLLCIPPLTPGDSGNDLVMSTWTKAAEYCENRRALLIVDAPRNWTVSAGGNAATTKITEFSAIVRRNASIYFPRIKLPDPLQGGAPDTFAPCGVIAGLMTRTDSTRGVWKAPAGIDAGLRGVMGLLINNIDANMTDAENGMLNPLGINCLRTFPGIGNVCWGARTLEGQDILASEWKYVPVRRLALFLEESLFRGSKWIVFEPNDEPTWANIRLNINAFMMSLFRQGAFQGTDPKDAFYVKCDKETTTQDDINKGIVNIEVGFAPLKPAEFVVIKFQQIAGDV